MLNGVELLKSSIINAPKIVQKFFPNRAENDPRSMKVGPWSVFGAKSRPGRLQDAPAGKPYPPKVDPLAEKVAPGIDFGGVFGVTFH